MGTKVNKDFSEERESVPTAEQMRKQINHTMKSTDRELTYSDPCFTV